VTQDPAPQDPATTRDAVEPKGPPLGRYDPDSDDELCEVRLIGLPLRLLAASREQHDELMREFAVLALDETEASEHVPARMLGLVDVLGRRYGARSARPDAEIDDAIEKGLVAIDVVYHVPSHVAEAAEGLEKLMREADEFCRDRQMLALARSDLHVEFAQWYLDEFKRQIAGEAPRAWYGPLESA
jgi:hypothetical protein